MKTLICAAATALVCLIGISAIAQENSSEQYEEKCFLTRGRAPAPAPLPYPPGGYVPPHDHDDDLDTLLLLMMMQNQNNFRNLPPTEQNAALLQLAALLAAIVQNNGGNGDNGEDEQQVLVVPQSPQTQGQPQIVPIPIPVPNGGAVGSSAIPGMSGQQPLIIEANRIPQANARVVPYVNYSLMNRYAKRVSSTRPVYLKRNGRYYRLR